MKLKTLLCLFLVLCTFFTFVGCDAAKPLEDFSTEGSIIEEPPIKQESSSETEFSEADTNPQQGELSPSSIALDHVDSAKIIKSETEIWDKTKETLTNKSVKITSNWKEQIFVGNGDTYNYISAINPTDISVVPNFFYDDPNHFIPLSDMEFDNKVNQALFSDEVRNEDDQTYQMMVGTTSYKGDIIVEELSFIATANYAEKDAFAKFIESAPQWDDAVGIGNTFAHTKSILGEPVTKIGEISNGEQTNVTYIYQDPTVILMLSFVRDQEDEEGDGVLTSIIWTPSLVKEILHTQEDIETFGNYENMGNSQVLRDSSSSAESITDSETVDEQSTVSEETTELEEQTSDETVESDTVLEEYADTIQ